MAVGRTLLLLHRQCAERLHRFGHLGLLHPDGLNVFREDRADSCQQSRVPLHQRAVAVEGNELRLGD